MLKKVVLLIVVFTCLTSVNAQQNVNNYKYVIVPNIYDFLNSEDEYQLNSISHFLFNKYGFTAIMQNDEFPEDLQKNGCLALRADVIKDKGMFTTKLHVILKNCNDQIIFEGANGESREKKFKVAYNIALREAFLYVKDLKYNYEPLKDNTNTINKEIVSKPAVVAASTEVVATKVNDDITDVAVQLEDNYTRNDETESNTLYAQPINNGYKLVNSTSKVVYVLIFSGRKDFYMVKGKDATVYKLDDNWVIAETVGDDLQVKTLDIKF